ncbi:MAG: hypothetical protein Q9219_006015 [cf. Caloplaca sp. 3 TL-2023]
MKQPTLAEQEENEMQMAMDMSRNGGLPAQEVGVTTADKPYFGPVRHDHDTKNWIMTTSKSTAKEILLNPEPKDRQRQSKTPAFLRPSPAGHRLPGLIKILHAVPAAREAFLSRGSLLSDYGRQNEWWDGMAIESPRIVHRESDQELLDKEVLHESQRLMAFLDHTQRAYGSSEALCTYPGIGEHQGDAVPKAFLATWSAAASHYNPESPFSELFLSTGVKTYKDDHYQEDIGMLDLDLNEHLVEPGHTLYDAVDSLLWPGWDGTETDEQVFLDRVAEVLIIRIARNDDAAKGLDVKIPPVWYADRYRQPSQLRVQQMLAAKAAVKNEIDVLNARKHKATEFRSFRHQGKPIDIKSLLQVTREHFDKTARFGEDVKEVQATDTEQVVPDPKVYDQISEELKALSERVAQKLQVFEESKEKAREKLRELSKLLTEPSNIAEETPHDKYTLRGVCADPSTVYVLERNIPDSDDGMPEGEADEWRWWKLSYEANAVQPISCNKVREVEVLKAARNEASSAYLVYASERAMTVEHKELPAPLKSFVEADNQAFAAELASSPSPPPRADPSHNDPFFSVPLDTTSEGPHQPGDFNLPSYNDPYRQTFAAPPASNSYDDYIPASLRPGRSSVDLDDEGLEMTQRDDGWGGGAFGGGGGDGGNIPGGYQLGSYVPEIRMQDEEETEEEERRRGMEG